MTTSEILDRSKSDMTPEMAIIVNRINRNAYNNAYYLERRDIINGKMSAAVPLTEECMTDIVDALSSEREDIIYGPIPENMIYADCRHGYKKYVWWHGPEKRQMYFKDRLNIPNGEMWVPGLIYVVIGKELSVYAFSGRRPKTKLFRAPFFNIYSNNKVCLGNAKVKQSPTLTYENIIKYWETMFWKSEFASLVDNNNPVKDNLVTLTKRLIRTGEKFPESELSPIKTTLKSLLK